MDIYPPDFSYIQQIIAESRNAALYEENSCLKVRIKTLEDILWRLKQEGLLEDTAVIERIWPGARKK